MTHRFSYWKAAALVLDGAAQPSLVYRLNLTGPATSSYWFL